MCYSKPISYTENVCNFLQISLAIYTPKCRGLLETIIRVFVDRSVERGELLACYREVAVQNPHGFCVEILVLQDNFAP